MKIKTVRLTIAGLLGTAILGAGIATPIALQNINKTSEAITTTDTTSYVSVGEIWNSADKEFNKNNTMNLFRYISNSAYFDFKDVESNATKITTASDIRKFSLSSAEVFKKNTQDVIVTLGGLKWEVVYLSNNTDGEPVLTLWLSNSTQDAFSGRSATEGQYYGYLNGGLYSDWSSNLYNYYFTVNYPTNMYGTSYIRAVTLNNGGAYVSSISATGSTAGAVSTLSTASKSSSNVFAPFTMAEFGLTEYIVTPNKMSWQKDQSSITTAGATYTYANEALGTPTTQNVYSSSYGKVSDMFGNQYYSAWGEDKLWLPSMAETGYSDSNLGMWGISENQRKNYNGSTTSSLGSVGSTSGDAYSHSWLRSGYYYSSKFAYILNPSGASYISATVNFSYAVRPALHLNLKKVYENIMAGYWDVHISNGFSGGDGTVENPYQISSAEEFALMAVNSKKDTLKEHYKLIANIDMRNYLWTGIGQLSHSFSGVFDGGFHQISGINILGESALSTMSFGCGLFNYNSGTIKNLFFTDSVINGRVYTGGIAGLNTKGTIENCVLDNVDVYKIEIDDNYSLDLGGVAGANSGIIKDCIFKNGEVIAKASTVRTGGISGDGDGNVIRCSVLNSRLKGYGSSIASMIAGNTNAVITSCYGESRDPDTMVLQRLMYGTDWSGWVYRDDFNFGYPVQSELLHIGGNLEDGVAVEDRLKELGFKQG